MAQSAEISNGNISEQERSPNNEAAVNAAMDLTLSRRDRNPTAPNRHRQKTWKNILGVFLLCLTSLALSVGILAHLGIYAHVPLFVVLVAAFGFIAWFSAVFLIFLLAPKLNAQMKNRRAREIDANMDSTGISGLELQGFRPSIYGIDGTNDPRHPISASTPPRRLGDPNSQAHISGRRPTLRDSMPITPVRPAHLAPSRSHDIFGPRPNPLASSPILGRAPPPVFPSVEALRATHRRRRHRPAAVVSASPSATVLADAAWDEGDPFRDAGVAAARAVALARLTGVGGEGRGLRRVGGSLE
ncbi:hypothetical protein LTR91_023184 [Friedmanniomyces endolithicus]|uniref:Uncharacterized protein n=1 Tax=Friedmanniomyces endolithicus TaxID=329885 RepID=A0AAN6H495_9PEZI|nr:hypothetical protein LTR94_020309 [Friedmanniomyces endolithicus]KAK0773939.1 hypothetical protein LTR38_016393 [Friedmanniomyces endolithicus]KAK0791819.1 hypothetical protein LTR59_008755 [Friedmanniomyces endolithicus]KAK0797596.1 hypothetical protein LTR75_009780 [Friedmanniomyces endolithicus]KAK0844461.1 hypothetical protein LTS02_015675 [Friedmanniomyces endolithicus]